MKIHLLFEQSGTFKNQFIKLGYKAYDYDIDDYFNETDYKLDLFNEIENAYLNKKSIFDSFNKTDILFAFFPCTYFSGQNTMIYDGTANQMRNMNMNEKTNYIKERKKERKKHFDLINKLVDICISRDFKLIIENPYQRNYLLTTSKFSNPDIIITDRSKYGDYYIKPTMFYFYNISPTFFNLNYIYENNLKSKSIIETTDKIERSLMHPTFAHNFIHKYIFGM